ncbi:hypothetical protein BpHYR1_047617 [Brachionus plicatilis]|uniref:Uncharacterized protein n=1 Tax=Brachionus plicatilis TaxID=10195 RepID=A0A3M7PW72_BRAPC|nr:hypothetical protein BpHYR1_047617 [Brachionus plicatilis]
MTKRRYWACPNKCVRRPNRVTYFFDNFPYSLNIFKLNGKKDLNPKPNTQFDRKSPILTNYIF